MLIDAENFLHNSVISLSCSSIFTSFSTFISGLDMSFGLVDRDDGCLTSEKDGLGMSSSHSNAGPAFLKVTRPCAIMRKLSHNCDTQHILTNPSYVLSLLLCAS